MTFQPIGTEHLSSPVPTILDAADKIAAAAALAEERRRKLADIAALHERVDMRGAHADECLACGAVWPCETMRIVERIDL